MFAVPATREMRPIGVLLGGSGRARILTTQMRVAALLRPYPCVSERNGSIVEINATVA